MDTLAAMEPALQELPASFLRGLRVDLGPDDGDEAFDRHILLAVRIHRAACLNQTAADRDGHGWTRYIHFPLGRNAAGSRR